MMKLTRRNILGGAAVAFCAPSPAHAAWPTRSITLVHGFGAGGNADILARMLGDRLSSRWGQSVVVEARPGAGGTTAALQVSRAAPDGYTLMIVVGGHAIAPALYKSLPYDPLRGFTFITMLAEYPFILVTYPDHPVKTPADLVATGRSRSEPMTYGTAGNGTTQHLSMELLAARAGIQLQHVPYRGNTHGTADLLAKRIDFMLEAPASVLSGIRAGQLHPVGVTSAKPFFALPRVPGFAAGVPDYDVTSWSGLGGPPDLPGDLVDKLNTEVRAVLAEPDIIERIRALGNEAAPTSPEAFRTRVVNDIAKWSEVVRTAKIQQI